MIEALKGWIINNILKDKKVEEPLEETSTEDIKPEITQDMIKMRAIRLLCKIFAGIPALLSKNLKTTPEGISYYEVNTDLGLRYITIYGIDLGKPISKTTSYNVHLHYFESEEAVSSGNQLFAVGIFEEKFYVSDSTLGIKEIVLALVELGGILKNIKNEINEKSESLLTLLGNSYY